MDQLIEFIINLFSVNDWPPRWHCGTWSDFHGWLYIISDVAIWFAYFVIPVILVWFLQKRPDVKFAPVFLLFGAFIVLCGTTHLIDAIIFWWPAYRLSALMRFFTAIVSMLTIFALIKYLPYAIEFIPQNEGESNEELNKNMEEMLILKNKEIDKLKAELDKHKS